MEKAEVDAWVDGWMAKVQVRAKVYREQGLSQEDAEERAVYDIRMEIRCSPPLVSE
jgi:hypothetical protein